jgi:SNF2 family DNA or RNA helicase
MGLGKSIQAIVAVRVLLRKGRISSGLILCPKSVLTDWEKKLWEWAPEIRVVRVRGTKEQRCLHWNTPAHIYLATYESFRQDLSGSLGEAVGEDDLAKNEFDLVIFDEIQKLKNPDSGVSKAAKLISAAVRWGLSGTPLENRLEELISVFNHIRPGVLHRGHAAHPWMVREAIKPHFLRRRKKEALPHLPEKVCEEAWLELTDSQRLTYEKAEREGIVELNEQGDQITVQHVLALITKLKQICNVDPVSKESSKLEFVREKLEEIVQEDDKALIFSQYPQKTVPHLRSQLQEFCPLEYSGALSDTERDSVTKRFNDDGQIKVLLMSVKAGGLGLTLTRANYVFHFDLWWNPAVASQAEDRAHRIGQRKTVFVTYLYTVDTIEERIQSLLRRKRELFRELIDDLSDTNLERVLSKEDLLSLFNIKLEGRKPIGQPATLGTVSGSLNNISADEFEELASQLYQLMGYDVRRTAATHDRGVDVYAKRHTESGNEYLAIQCKHYPNGVVGVEHARALYGVIQAEPSVTKGVLLTSGSFSRDCKEFAQGKRIELFDGSYLHGLLEKYNLSSTAPQRLGVQQEVRLVDRRKVGIKGG